MTFGMLGLSKKLIIPLQHHRRIRHTVNVKTVRHLGRPNNGLRRVGRGDGPVTLWIRPCSQHGSDDVTM